MWRKGKMIIAAAISFMALSVGNASADTDYYVLREYNGKVALFYGNATEPEAVYDTSADSFYPADRALLEEGIILSSREELRRLIEDLDLN